MRTMTSAPRVATYHRVSSLDGSQDQTLAREELRAAAGRLGQLVMEVEEQGSGARNDRPGLQKLLAEARRGRVDVVVVWKLDRFGRSTLDLLANVQALQAAGVRFTAITQGINIAPQGDAVSNLMLTMLAGVAEFERALIRERVTLGLRRAKERGTKTGKAIGRPRVVDAGQGAKVREMRAAGASWSKVATALGCTVGSARRAADRAA
jgi:DNA invertase Pin-like site-specific DNA recombinase